MLGVSKVSRVKRVSEASAVFVVSRVLEICASRLTCISCPLRYVRWSPNYRRSKKMFKVFVSFSFYIKNVPP